MTARVFTIYDCRLRFTFFGALSVSDKIICISSKTLVQKSFALFGCNIEIPTRNKGITVSTASNQKTSVSCKWDFKGSKWAVKGYFLLLAQM